MSLSKVFTNCRKCMEAACEEAFAFCCLVSCVLQTSIRLSRNRELKKREDPAVMQELRDKFVDQAKKYFGVPYAKRYQEKGSK